MLSFNIKRGLSVPELLLADTTSHVLVLGRGVGRVLLTHIGKRPSTASQGLLPATGLSLAVPWLGCPQFSV